MFTAIKDNKIIAYNNTGDFPCLVYDEVREVADVELVEVDGEFVLKTDDKAIQKVNQERIAELKQFLADTDYISNKLIEAVDDAELNDLKEKYADILRQRREARARINELEGSNGL